MTDVAFFVLLYSPSRVKNLAVRLNNDFVLPIANQWLYLMSDQTFICSGFILYNIY